MTQTDRTPKRSLSIVECPARIEPGDKREPGQAGAGGPGAGKFLSPERRRRAVNHARQEHGISERHACRLVNQPRGTQRLLAIRREDEDALTGAIIQLAHEYGRYGYRRSAALLQQAGWLESNASGVAKG